MFAIAMLPTTTPNFPLGICRNSEAVVAVLALGATHSYAPMEFVDDACPQPATARAKLGLWCALRVHDHFPMGRTAGPTSFRAERLTSLWPYTMLLYA